MTPKQTLSHARKAIIAAEPRRDTCYHDDWKRLLAEIDERMRK